MRSLLYPKLAAINIRKHSQLYLPYLISCAVTVGMFYIMLALTNNSGIMRMRGADSLEEILNVGIVVIGVFSTIFLVYTNSFIIKRRTSEFGLYSVLGMEKRHIGRVMFFETIYSFLISVVSGIALGIVFYKLITLLLYNILHFDIQLGFYISYTGVAVSAIVFAAIFFLCLVINIIRVRRTNAINLLQTKNAGEKEPKTKWISAVLGVLLLATGYTISIVVESPIQAIPLFLLAVLCVIFGTYLLFMAGSIAFLKLLRKNKNYYYNVRHFNSVSGMLYRMKQNAVGLGNICVLSTMVLVMISSTVSLYSGAEDALKTRYPSDIEISDTYYCIPNKDGSLEESYGSLVEKSRENLQTAKSLADKHGLTIENSKSYTYLSFYSHIKNGKLDGNENFGSMAILCFITAEDYNRLTGESVSLTANEFAFYSKRNAPSGTVEIGGKTYSFAKQLDSFPNVGDFISYVADLHYIVVANSDVIDEFYQMQAKNPERSTTQLSNEIHFDTNGEDGQKTALADDIDNATHHTSVDCRQAKKSGFYATYGGFFFLGIVLGTLFMFVTVMIIYYKQISEGYDDKRRFAIMQQVGMSSPEIKGTIRSQILTVFFLPIVTAFIHLAFSFPIISRLLALFGLTNQLIFLLGMIVTAAAFTVIYTVVYIITSKTYYRIVS